MIILRPRIKRGKLVHITLPDTGQGQFIGPTDVSATYEPCEIICQGFQNLTDWRNDTVVYSSSALGCCDIYPVYMSANLRKMYVNFTSPARYST